MTFKDSLYAEYERVKKKYDDLTELHNSFTSKFSNVCVLYQPNRLNFDNDNFEGPAVNGSWRTYPLSGQYQVENDTWTLITMSATFQCLGSMGQLDVHITKRDNGDTVYAPDPEMGVMYDNRWVEKNYASLSNVGSFRLLKLPKGRYSVQVKSRGLPIAQDQGIVGISNATIVLREV